MQEVFADMWHHTWKGNCLNFTVSFLYVVNSGFIGPLKKTHWATLKQQVHFLLKFKCNLGLNELRLITYNLLVYKIENQAFRCLKSGPRLRL